MGFLLVVLLFYAVNILRAFRKGMLERGWKLLSQGIIILVVGEVLLGFSNYYPVGGYLYQLGLAVDMVGVFCAILGFRSQYIIWSTGFEKQQKETLSEKPVL